MKTTAKLPQKGAIRPSKRPANDALGAQTIRAHFEGCLMKSLILLALAALTIVSAEPAVAQKAQYDALVATHAKANGVPESLVHRIIVRESKYNASLLGRGGTIGLMQIKLGTARALGYSGTAEGLRDPETNLTYAVKYLAGAFRAANGDFNRSVAYYAGGYYYVAKRLRHEISGPPHQPIFAKDAEKPKQQATVDANAQAAKP
jgi:soluble lytic murein transglycosylase-like protein